MKVLNASLAAQSAWVRRTRWLMGTFVEIEIEAEGKAKADAVEALEEAFLEMKRTERLFSRFRDDSPVSQVNRFGNKFPVPVPEEAMELVFEALQCSEQTGGAFNIASGGLTKLWEDAAITGRFPAEEEIETALQGAEVSNVVLSRGENTIFLKHKRTQLDFGGIAKGYAVDRAVSALRNRGAANALINAGGQVYVINNERGVEIGVANPLCRNEFIDSVTLQNQSVATSAGCERFFEMGGVKHGHIVDPRTGRPSENAILSASVISSSAKIADVFSTAVYVLGLDEGMRLVQSREDLTAVIATDARKGLRIHAALKQPTSGTGLPKNRALFSTSPSA